MAKPTRLVSILLTMVMVVVSSASAQEARQGQLSATTFASVPKDDPVYVRFLNDSADNVILKKAFEKALVSQGYKVSDSASGLVLTFSSDRQAGLWTDAPRRTLVELSGQTGSGSSAEGDSRVVLNLFDTQQGALLNENPNRRAGAREATIYRVDARLEDRRNGRTIWQGWTRADADAMDARSLDEVMASELVANVGQTKRDEYFKLQ